MPADTTKIGRIAFREIRDEMRAYYAMPDTMKEALLLGTMKRALLGRPERFEAWRLLLRDIVGDIIEAAAGQRPPWPNPPMPAPEHERGKAPWKGDA